MLDSITVANLPDGADAYAGYVDGAWPTFSSLKKRFGGKAHLLSIAVFASGDAQCLDVEIGDATPVQAPAWVRRQHARGVARPVLYANASTMGTVLAAVHQAGITRSGVRLWSAHYNGVNHVCGPHSCAFPGVPLCDGTQWRDNAPGRGGALVDESNLADDFFGGAPKPKPPVMASKEDLMILLTDKPTPVVIPSHATHLIAVSNEHAKLRVDWGGKPATVTFTAKYGEAGSVPVPDGIRGAIIHRDDAGTNPVAVGFRSG